MALALLTGACAGTADAPRLGSGRDLRMPTGDLPSAAPVTLPSVSGTTNDLPVVRGLAPPPPPPVLKPFPSDLLFATRSAVLTPEGVAFVQSYARHLLKDFPTASVRLVGHTDSRGTDADNVELSLSRARAVLEQFALAGFARDRLSAVGAGEGRPVKPDTSAAGVYDERLGSVNRRVEVQVRV